MTGGQPAVGHVVLVGLMGSGKTTVGRRTAKALGRTFVDCDEAFVARTGRTVAEVFATDGEAGFRLLEADLVRGLLAVGEPLVIATGGGAVLDPATRAALAEPATFVVWLRADPAFLASRTKQRSHRPLLAGAEPPAAVLARLAAERHPLYEEVADEILDIAAFHEWGSEPKKGMAARIATLVAERRARPDEGDAA